MSADNVVLLFILLWPFIAVCQDDDNFIVWCGDVTGYVGKEVTFNCSVSLLDTECCIIFYTFQFSEIYIDSAICTEESPLYNCDHRNSFTCRYTPTTAMREKCRFFLATVCGASRTNFFVDIAEPVMHETNTEAPGKKDFRTKDIIITVLIVVVVIIIIHIIIIFCVKRFKSTNPSGLQKKNERVVSEEQTMMTTSV